MKQTILLIGGRTKAKSLALSLLHRGYKVRVINASREDCRRLSEIRGIDVIYGDGTKPYVLEDAGAQDVDIAIALTPKDQDNLVCCELCKRRFGIPKTVSLTSDQRKVDFFRKMGIDRVVCAISAITAILEQHAFVDEIENIVTLEDSDLAIVKLRVEEGAPIADTTLRDITLPGGALVGCILRRENTTIPDGDAVIRAGDILIVIARNGAIARQVKELTVCHE